MPQTAAERRRLFLVVGISCLVGWLAMAGLLVLLYWSYGLDPDWELIAHALALGGMTFGVAILHHYAPRLKNNGDSSDAQE
jgi:hypothetical protein